MSTQRTIRDYHISFAIDGLASALSYLPAGFGPEVDAVRDLIIKAQIEVNLLNTPIWQPGYAECKCGALVLFNGEDVNHKHGLDRCQ